MVTSEPSGKKWDLCFPENQYTKKTEGLMSEDDCSVLSPAEFSWKFVFLLNGCSRRVVVDMCHCSPQGWSYAGSAQIRQLYNWSLFIFTEVSHVTAFWACLSPKLGSHISLLTSFWHPQPKNTPIHQCPAPFLCEPLPTGSQSSSKTVSIQTQPNSICISDTLAGGGQWELPEAQPTLKDGKMTTLG